MPNLYYVRYEFRASMFLCESCASRAVRLFAVTVPVPTGTGRTVMKPVRNADLLEQYRCCDCCGVDCTPSANNNNNNNNKDSED